MISYVHFMDPHHWLGSMCIISAMLNPDSSFEMSNFLFFAALTHWPMIKSNFILACCSCFLMIEVCSEIVIIFMILWCIFDTLAVFCVRVDFLRSKVCFQKPCSKESATDKVLGILVCPPPPPPPPPPLPNLLLENVHVYMYYWMHQCVLLTGPICVLVCDIAVDAVWAVIYLLRLFCVKGI